MSLWFCLDLGDGMFASGPLKELKERFVAAYARVDSSSEMGLFVRHEEGGLHCQVRAYLTPASAPVARQVGATPCTKPCSDGLHLVAGSEQAWRLLSSGSSN